jgi:hypothetical protein
MMTEWYRAPSLLALALLVAVMLVDRPSAARVVLAVSATLCLARLVQPIWDVRMFPVANPLGLQAADWLRPRLAEGAVAASWNAGLIGYFSGGRVVNLDGLANDATFLREVVRGRDLAGYLEREGVRFLAEVATTEQRPAPLVRRYPPAVSQPVEAAYRRVAVFDDACAALSGCLQLIVWERSPPPPAAASSASF